MSKPFRTLTDKMSAEARERAAVRTQGFKRIDWKAKPPRCPHCGSHRFTRIDRYDAMACRACNLWLEPTCSQGESCDVGFCKGRPPTPEGVNWDDPNNTEYGT